MASAPTLYWYQLDSGTLAATYFGQLDATVAALCSENAVTAPTAPWQNSIGGTLVSQWTMQVDTAVRALCAALAVAEPIPLILGLNTGQYQSDYAESLDGVVRSLCSVYHADAVNFDNATWLSITSLLSTDNAFFSLSVWLKVSATVNTGDILYVAAPDTDYTPWFGFGGSGGNRWYTGALGDHSGSGNRLEFAEPGGPFITAAWHHILLSADAQNGVLKIYVDDVAYGDITVNGGAFNFEINGKMFAVGSDTLGGAELTGDVADFWCAPGQSLLTAGDITEATRRKFISAGGKPVSLGVDGSNPTGIAPRIFFSGDAAAFGTNKGTGGAFTTTGTLTNASTSPSD